jgi:hypothetical protein
MRRATPRGPPQPLPRAGEFPDLRCFEGARLQPCRKIGKMNPGFSP